MPPPLTSSAAGCPSTTDRIGFVRENGGPSNDVWHSNGGRLRPRARSSVSRRREMDDCGRPVLARRRPCARHFARTSPMPGSSAVPLRRSRSGPARSTLCEHPRSFMTSATCRRLPPAASCPAAEADLRRQRRRVGGEGESPILESARRPARPGFRGWAFRAAQGRRSGTHRRTGCRPAGSRGVPCARWVFGRRAGPGLMVR
jgi:hypothetical protein